MSQKNEQQEKKQVQKTTHEKYTDVYVDFLTQYKIQLSSSMKTKNILKCCFFGVIVFVMIAVIVAFLIVVWRAFDLLKENSSIETATASAVSIVSSFVTVIVSILKLPKIVALYLFNKEEDNLMKDVISNIQNYEINAIELELKKLTKTVADSLGTENNGEAKEQLSLESDMELLTESPNANAREPSDKPAANKVKENQENT